MKTRCHSQSYQFMFSLELLQVGPDDDHNSGLRSQPTNPARCDSYEIICKVSGRTGKFLDNLKCPDNLENVSAQSKKSLDDIEVCLDNLESFWMILKVSG